MCFFRNYKLSLPVDDIVVVPTPDFEAVRVSGRNVSNNVDLLVLELGALQLVDEPLQFGAGVGAVEQQPPVPVVAVVHVERDDAKTWSHQHRVKGAAAHCRTGGRRQPVPPLLVHLLVQPVDRIVFFHEWRRKTNKKSNI